MFSRFEMLLHCKENKSGWNQVFQINKSPLEHILFSIWYFSVFPCNSKSWKFLWEQKQTNKNCFLSSSIYHFHQCLTYLSESVPGVLPKNFCWLFFQDSEGIRNHSLKISVLNESFSRVREWVIIFFFSSVRGKFLFRVSLPIMYGQVRMN